jgi:mannose-6-phosphate isomerase-like protein (cupin superfamily)/catechol 2,3-dioxygenase-like lactoylglutathione lyase family enzyme
MSTDPSTSPTCPAIPGIKAAQLCLPCPDLAATLDFFLAKLGFRVDVIFPADAPTTAIISGHGLSLRLVQHAPNTTGHTAPPGTQHDNNHGPSLHLLCDTHAWPAEFSASLAQPVVAPGGIRIYWQEQQSTMALPPTQQKFVLCRNTGMAAWHVGRAGLEYRDLLPDRLGGAFVASQIRVPRGGPVADWVHFHKVRFQMIFCKSGWVRVVYEDQGSPFLLQAGDCVLQPPEIRHRVLEASEGMEVIEIGCPAIHETIADHQLKLPTAAMLPNRRFSGQRFVRHHAAHAPWQGWRLPGFEVRDIGIAAATDSLAGVQVVRPDRHSTYGAVADSHHGEFMFWFVLAGSLHLDSPTLGKFHLLSGDSCVLPTGTEFTLRPEAGLELLEVTLPAR